MILKTIRLVADRRTVARYLALLGLSAVLRAGAVLSLIPLLTTSFTAGAVTALPWLGAFTAFVVSGWLVDHAVATSGYSIGFALMGGVEERVLERLRRVPLGWLTAERKTAARTALTSSGRELVQGIAWLLTPAVNALTTPILIGAGLLVVAPPLGLAALASVPLLLGALWAGGRSLKAADEAYDAASAELGERVIELAQAQPALRAAGRAGPEGSMIGRALARQRTAALRLIGFGIPGQLLFGLATQAGLITLAVTAVVLGLTGELTAVEVIAVIVVTVRFIEPFVALGELSPAIQAARGMLARLHGLLDAPSLSPHPPHAVNTPAEAPALELRDVRFGYHEDRDTIAGVSFAVRRGTTTAIVGPSGSGKSTLLALIARFHEVTGGEIRLAGHDVRSYDPAELMKGLSVVFQDVYLFDASLEENVRLGNPAASQAQVRAAVTAAGLDEVVGRLPEGWATRVGERGAALSGGERQRVSIARALLKDASLLLLDEATAALDSGNEKAVIAALKASTGDRATVIVAHRLTTIAHADHIIFLEDGRVAEAGTLSELLAADGRFAAYWRLREQAAGWTLEGAHTQG